MNDFNTPFCYEKIMSAEELNCEIRNKKTNEIQDALTLKNNAVNLIERIRFSQLSNYEYRSIRDALESMAILLECELCSLKDN